MNGPFYLSPEGLGLPLLGARDQNVMDLVRAIVTKWNDQYWARAYECMF